MQCKEPQEGFEGNDEGRGESLFKREEAYLNSCFNRIKGNKVK